MPCRAADTLARCAYLLTAFVPITNLGKTLRALGGQIRRNRRVLVLVSRDLLEIMYDHYRASKFSSTLVLYFFRHSDVLDRRFRSANDHAYSLASESEKEILTFFGMFSE